MGRHVVTANKAVAAKYLDEFLQAAKENNVEFVLKQVLEEEFLALQVFKKFVV